MLSFSATISLNYLAMAIFIIKEISNNLNYNKEISY